MPSCVYSTLVLINMQITKSVVSDTRVKVAYTCKLNHTWWVRTEFVCASARVTNGGSGVIMSIARLQLPYPRISGMPSLLGGGGGGGSKVSMHFH